jgi:DNA-binding CsgD family transcriptional regulator
MGYGSDRVAETMSVKVNTARAHTHNVYVKLDVHSREELMRLVDEAVARQ